MRSAFLLVVGLTWLITDSQGQGEESPPVYEYIPNPTYELIEDRIRCIEQDVPLVFNEKVKGFIDYFTVRNREYTRMVISKTDRYFPIFSRALRKHGLPDELKYLSIVESGLNPRAISRAGAGGLWQFMPATGRLYKLHKDWYIDERLDPYQSTEAACRYLKQLYRIFGDWELALAAYNSGPGNVRRAIRRSGGKKTFWGVYRYLPRETRSYVPQFVAVVYALKYAPEHNLVVEDQLYEQDYDTVHVSQYLHLPTFADQLNICYEELEQLNPHIKRGALPKEVRGYPLRVPQDKYDEIVTNRTFLYDTAGKVGQKELEYMARNTPGSTFGRDKLVYRVRSGDVLGTIAQRYDVRVSDLRKWNGINGNLIRVGQRLNIWVLPHYYKKSSKTATAAVAKNPTPPNKSVASSTTTKGLIYYVKPGDTLWDIARKYQGLTVEKIKRLNNLKSNAIKPGMKLVLG